MSGQASQRRLPSPGVVTRTQLRLIVGRRPRPMMVALTIVLVQIIAAASGGILFGITIQSSHEAPTRVLFSKVSDFADEVDFAVDEGSVAVIVAALAAFIWAFFWPFRVWREERPQNRGYHWAMPVDRRTHDLLRVGAGLALLPVITLLFVLVAIATAALFGHTAVFPGWGGLFWINLLASPPLIYLLVSIPVVGSRHPSAWLWGTLGAIAALLSAFYSLGLAGLWRPLVALLHGGGGLLTTLGAGLISEFAGWGSRPAGPWALSWLVWLALAAGGVWVAASRRHPSI